MTAALALALLALAPLAPLAASASAPVRVGAGAHTYEWVHDWLKLPDGMKLGNTHGCIAFDSAGNVYFNTDTENSVMVFRPDGTFVRGFGKDWAGGLHGMVIVKETAGEFLYICHTQQGRVVKATLTGETMWSLGCPMESQRYANPGEYHPTSIAVAPDGRLFVGDGYGKSWVHLYDANQKYVRSFGGPGSEPGQIHSPHGIWMDTREKTSQLVVADRENHRVQTFDLDGNLLRVVNGDFRRPSNFGQRGSELAIADLEGRVTIVDKDWNVVLHLCDQPDPKLRAQNGVAHDLWKDGEFISPHCARWDANGDLYVMDWNFEGRVSKLVHVTP